MLTAATIFVLLSFICYAIGGFCNDWAERLVGSPSFWLWKNTYRVAEGLSYLFIINAAACAAVKVLIGINT